MLQKLLENKWIIVGVVLAIIAIYYFYQKNYGES